MKRTMKAAVSAALMTVLLLWSVAAPAQSSFDVTGTIQRVDHERGIMVVDDAVCRLGSQVVLHTPTGIESSRALESGLRIGLKLGDTAASAPAGMLTGEPVNEIWVISDSEE